MFFVMTHHKGLLAGLAVTAAMGVFIGPATGAILNNAIYTPRTEPRPGEGSHREILEHLYGGTFVSTGTHGLDFSNGTIYVQRIADDRDTDQVLTNIGQTNGNLTQYTDQVWEDQFSIVQARARFASYGQSFGFIAGDGDRDDYTKLFDVIYEHEFAPYQTAVMPDLGGETFRWARGGQNGVWSSDPTQNRDEKDHLITYKIMPVNGQVRGTNDASEDELLVELDQYKMFLLFWEDQSDTGNVNWYDKGDWDYNDLVVEVRAQYAHVPEPAAALTGLGLIGLLGMRRRRA